LNPAEVVGIFREKKSSACRRSHVAELRHVKDPYNDVEVAIVGKITGHFVAHISPFPC
jgi:hypothetical protein